MSDPSYFLIDLIASASHTREDRGQTENERVANPSASTVRGRALRPLAAGKVLYTSAASCPPLVCHQALVWSLS